VVEVEEEEEEEIETEIIYGNVNSHSSFTT